MRTLVFLASLLIAGPSLAQPLLVEFRNAMMSCFDCQPIEMRIEMVAGPVWTLPVTQSDVARTFAMPTDVLDDFAATLTSGDENLLITMNLDSIGPGGPNASGYVPSGIFTTGSLSNNPQVIRHVPVLGSNLTGYTISSITHTLNSLEIIQQSSTRYLLTANSSFHIYGAAIPEPSTFVLILFAHCSLWVRLFRRQFRTSRFATLYLTANSSESGVAPSNCHL